MLGLLDLFVRAFVFLGHDYPLRVESRARRPKPRRSLDFIRQGREFKVLSRSRDVLHDRDDLVFLGAALERLGNALDAVGAKASVFQRQHTRDRVRSARLARGRIAEPHAGEFRS